MGIKVSVKDYDKSKAKWYFAWYKFLEVFGVFLFFVGFHSLGSYVYKHYPVFANLMLSNVTNTYFSLWLLGLLTFLVFIAGLFFVILIGSLIYILIKEWVKGNWEMAKKKTETKKSKKKRLEEQVKVDLYLEIQEKVKDRKKYGFCVGDEAKYINKNSEADNRARLGQKCKIGGLDEDGGIKPLWEDGTEGSVCDGYYIQKTSFKIIKKHKIPKKPKLNKESLKKIKDEEE